MAFNEEILKKLYWDLDDKESIDEACEVCELPKLVHTADTRCNKTDLDMERVQKVNGTSKRLA